MCSFVQPVIGVCCCPPPGLHRLSEGAVLRWDGGPALSVSLLLPVGPGLHRHPVLTPGGLEKLRRVRGSAPDPSRLVLSALSQWPSALFLLLLLLLMMTLLLLLFMFVMLPHGITVIEGTVAPV